jgi:hypothetical protein
MTQLAPVQRWQLLRILHASTVMPGPQPRLQTAQASCGRRACAQSAGVRRESPQLPHKSRRRAAAADGDGLAPAPAFPGTVLQADRGDPEAAASGCQPADSGCQVGTCVVIFGGGEQGQLAKRLLSQCCWLVATSRAVWQHTHQPSLPPCPSVRPSDCSPGHPSGRRAQQIDPNLLPHLLG